jgi:hypothetical protein
LHKWTPPNILYYFTFFNSLNYSTIFSKYQYHPSKSINWVPLIPQYHYPLTILIHKVVVTKKNKHGTGAKIGYGGRLKTSIATQTLVSKLTQVPHFAKTTPDIHVLTAQT